MPKEAEIRPLAHVTVSLGLGAGLYAIHPDPLPASLVFFSGTLVDADHLFDLWKYQKHRAPGEKLFDVFDAHYWVKTYVFLHAMELIPVFALLALFGSRSWMWTGLLIGYGTHLLLDAMWNKAYPLTYFLLYRICRGFDARLLWRDSRSKSGGL